MENDSTHFSREATNQNTTPKSDAAASLFLRNTMLVVLLFTGLANDLSAQYCNGNVPSFIVNLTGNPTGTWISPPVQRNDQCCSAQAPDQCVQFVVTLDPASQGIIFDIASGAVPPGAIYYQINCGPPTPVGSPICLSGVGPHYLTFCKPGNNTNTYSITSIGAPSASGDITINDGCSGVIAASGYEDSTISWTSIFPGAAGDYNGYLSCTNGCDTTYVTGMGPMPPYVDYRVCGTPAGGCGSPICDTVRVYFNPTLAVTINPAQPTVCFGQTGTWITANATGGSPPYTYLWSNGATTASVFVGAGNYSVAIGDQSSCPSVSNSVTVTSFTATITANAGPDINMCTQQISTALNGSVTGTTTGIWTGGSGTFTPNNTTLNATYTPSAAEVIAGQTTLHLITTNTGTCPPDTDDVVIYIHQFQGTVVTSSTDVSCFGQGNGTGTVSINGGSGTYNYTWNSNPQQTTATATGLAPGTYSVTVTNGFGCTSGATISISEPPLLTISAAGIPATCNGACNGQVVAVPAGGTQPYSLLWNTGCTSLSCGNICAGSYTVMLNDANGCNVSATTTVTEPSAMIITTSATSAHCNQADGSVSATAAGGSPGYQFTWNPGNIVSATAPNLPPGNYTVTVTDQQNCVSTSPATISNLPGVTAAVSNVTQPLCAGACTGAATANASGGSGPYQYSWSNSTSNQTATGLCESATPYLLTITDADGCNDTASFYITAPPPVDLVAPSPNIICIGQSISLNATASGGTPGYTYNFSSGQTVSPTVTTTYTVTATDANGCTSAPVTITVPVHPPLSVNVAASGTSCAGNPVQLVANASGGNGGPYYYTWSTSQTGNAINVAPTTSTSYSVTATDNCTSPTATATVPVNPFALPVVSFFSDDTAGCQNACIQFTNTTSNAASYLWNFGDGNTSTATSPTNCYGNAGNYNVTLAVTDNNGCTGTATQPSMINIHPNPVADFTLGPQPTTILNPGICYTDHSSSDAVDWYWNFNDPNDITTSTLQNPCHSFSDTGNYCTDLVVHNNYGCMSSIEYCLRIDPYYSIYIPNAFTPNNDGINDYFYPVLFNVDAASYHMEIYDRWGNLIYQTSDVNAKWDGRGSDGQMVQMDAYVWKIKVEDYTGARHSLIGHVSVIK